MTQINQSFRDTYLNPPPFDPRPSMKKSQPRISQKLDFQLLDNLRSTLKKDGRDQEVEDDSMEVKPGDLTHF